MSIVDEMVKNAIEGKIEMNIGVDPKSFREIKEDIKDVEVAEVMDTPPANVLEDMLNDGNKTEILYVKTDSEPISTAWKFENVTPVYRNGSIAKYETKLSAGALAHLWEYGRAKYKGDIQRGTKTNKKGESIDVFSPTKVKEIYNAMINDKIHGGLITLNYSKDNESLLEYNEEDGTINGLDPLDVSDGSHRTRACVMWAKAFELNPEGVGDPNDFEFIVAIENLTDEQAKGLFAEYALKPKKISSCRAEYLNILDPSATIARRIVKESQLHEKVELVTTSIKGKPNLIITFSTLTQSIRNNFKPATKNEIERIGNLLIKFFDELIETFPGLMGNDSVKRGEQRKKFLAIENICWNGYMSTFAKIIDRKDWKHKINRLNNNVTIGNWKGKFLSRENPMFSFIYDSDGKIINNSSTVSRVTKMITDYALGEKSIDQIIKGEDLAS